jgi:zeta-carotene desaturase
MSQPRRGMPWSSSDSKPVIVVGGGLAGLSAAVDLTSRAIPTLLLEQRDYCGGRAYSFRDRTTGDIVDNGQHVLIAGYERTLAFLKRIGTDRLLAVQERPTLVLHHPTRGMCEFRLPKMPRPFHVLGGILSTNLFSLRDKVRVLRAAWTMRASAAQGDELTIDGWLDSVGQSEETKRSFWEPLAISIMNEHLASASAKVFISSLRHAFLSGWKNSALAIPRVGLSELYVDSAVQFILAHGGDIRTGAEVVGIDFETEKGLQVRCKTGSAVECSALILAVPHHRVASLLETDERNSVPSTLRSSLSALSSTSSIPIVSIHLWFERDFMPHDVIGLIGRRVQWVFNKRKLFGEQRADGHVSCVISAAKGYVDMTNEQLERIALEDLQSVYPDAPSNATSALCVRERRATFSCTPNTERLRPEHATPIPNLFLAGDWTATGLPATIEGAVISGERCAELALENVKRDK